MGFYDNVLNSSGAFFKRCEFSVGQQPGLSFISGKQRKENRFLVHATRLSTALGFGKVEIAILSSTLSIEMQKRTSIKKGPFQGLQRKNLGFPQGDPEMGDNDGTN